MSTVAGVRSRSMRRLVAATVVGNTIEFYDFAVYGTLTAIVFSKIFFPQSDPSVATLLVLATFAVGFLSRPLGGVIFGHLGDRIGRKPTLILSMLLMGGATALMGVLPSYESAGIAAPMMLVGLRFLQGFGIGGEWGGAVSLMIESAPRHRRGIYGAAVQTGSGLGIILSTLTVTILTTTLTSEQLLAWGWRIPLLLSVVLIVVGLVIRSSIDESPEFARVLAGQKVVRVPVWETLCRHWRTVLLAIAMYIGVAAFGFTQGVFFVGHLVNEIGLPRPTATEANLIAAVFYLLATLVGGLLSDRLGRIRAYVLGGVALIPAPYLMFWAGDTASVPLIFAAMGVVGVLSGVAYGAQAALFFELFPAKLRYTGISLASRRQRHWAVGSRRSSRRCCSDPVDRRSRCRCT
ncbi:MFS transporter [Kribbella sp. VKM Ac-2569]|uniref:MFS transporter n=1 Tax=Kribbella sp. VKM Ac-2569 TaxID=2512220 RepID=UPI00102B1975|nr:MFS transporter [Kribbella sp. VKM Ac-2569]RZT27543.1 MFS transporter [Kribbella sp. VKM Ac-2569]